MSTPTPLHLPSHLPYPIKIVAFAVQPHATVERGTRLLTYSFSHVSKESGKEVRFGTWDSPIEGTVDSWVYKLNESVSARRSADQPAIRITEPCKHEIQLHGLCCVCGKDMTSYDYTGFSDASRASIQMTHAANGPTVSLEEAQRIERETAEHLRRARKLSLIVDLDQTIVHATVDPTVGEWIAEGEAWEARRSKREAASKAGEGAEGSDPSSQPAPAPESEDEVNPNWDALKDVKKFRLGPEALGQQYWGRMGTRPKPKVKSVEVEGCMYYIKPRPGYKGFLESMANKYEMHVYTMGTRAYAEEVCATIDPEGKIFGGRVLSRDESGSLTQKSLQRLFPVDQSMVVIIDDRADVWEWSPNLIKVIPYDFFVGIGDINSAFLPKLEPLAPNMPSPPGVAKTPSASPAPAPGAPKPPSLPPPPPITAAVDDEDRALDLASDSTGPTPEEEELAEMRKSEILARNAAGLDALVEQRPLAKMQEELLEMEEKEARAESERAESESGEGKAAGEVGEEKKAGEGAGEGGEGEGEGSGGGEEGEPATNGKTTTPPPPGAGANGAETKSPTPRSTTPKPEKHARKALLKNDDVELARVQQLLEDVHQRYYDAYDKQHEATDDRTARRKPSKHHAHGHMLDYDVRRIIPELRQHTLDGTHLLFSSVIPLDTRPESTEIWRTAEAFGAKCYTELGARITHVVAAKRGTVKVDAARRQGGIKIVWLAWFTDSIALWERQDETPYLIDPEPAPPPAGPASPPSPDTNQISSDPEPDADDWDEDRAAGGSGAGAGAGAGGSAGGSGVKSGAVSESGEGGEGEAMALDVDVDWAAMDDEVEAAMNESDDDEDGRSTRSGVSMRSGARSGNVSEDEGWTDESNSIISSAESSPRKRKRLRSLTPSEPGGVNGDDADALRSPLAKRKKLAAERAGASKLKEAVSADDLEQELELAVLPDLDAEKSSGSAGATPGRENGDEDDEDENENEDGGEDGAEGEDAEEDEDEDDSDDSDDDEEDEDDFLTRELGEDWG